MENLPPTSWYELRMVNLRCTEERGEVFDRGTDRSGGVTSEQVREYLELEDIDPPRSYKPPGG